jgi:Domain of unknown function (DUF5667)
MPAGQGKDAERFAAAVESRTPLGPADDADLARELEVVAMLRSRGAAFAPDAETKARAKQRLMAVLAAEQGGPRPVARSASPVTASPVAAETTAPLGRPVERDDVDPSAETTRMAPITTPVVSASEGTADDTADGGTAVEPIPLHGSRSGRKSRHRLPDRSGGRDRRAAAAAPRGRMVLVGAAAAATMLAIASGGVLASSDTLPGDGLYPVKRVAESAGLALTFDDASRARRHLEIAAIRLSEVEQLARNAQAAPAPEVFTETMDDFDAATDEGSRLMLASAESDQASTAADDLHDWAARQSERLTELEPELPPAANADASIELLERLLGQTQRLEAGAACDEGDCVPGRAGDQGAPESDAKDATEDATSTPDEEGSSDSRGSDEPSRTPSETTDREDPGLLPDLLPNQNRDDDEEGSGTSREDEESPSTSESESGDEGEGGDVSVPLPLLPPVTLPPLIPGMPGITIG